MKCEFAGNTPWGPRGRVRDCHISSPAKFYPRSPFLRRTGPHPARRTFQALRIEVNNELGELETSLPQAIDALEPGGRVAVISYHSLEDRLVKRTFADASAGCRCPRDLPVCVCGAQAMLRVVTRKPLRPTPDELEANPRASSALLRVAERLDRPEPS